MKINFTDTLLYRTLSIPGMEWDKSCRYIFALKLPAIFVLVLVGIPVALIVDFIWATINTNTKGENE